MRPFVILLASVLSLQGCVQTIAIRTVSGIMEYGFEALNEESDLELARTALASNLKLIEAMAKGDPENEQLLMFASQGYNAYALSFVEDDSIARARVLYLRGRDFALRVLSQHGLKREVVEGDPRAFTSALERLDDSAVPALFWGAFGWGSYINITRTDMSALADLPKVNAMMQFVRTRDPRFYFSGADLYLGSVYGSLPPMLGGKPEVSKEHFETAIAATGGTFLMAYVYYAKTYAVQTQDQDLFIELLKKVEEFPLDARPETRLANAVAKEKARRLLARATDLF